MIPFRARSAAPPQPVTPEAIRRLAQEVLAPACFFLGPSWQLAWRHVPAADISWEVFQGRLLDPAHTRARRTFEEWNVYRQTDEGLPEEPVISLKWEAGDGQIFVVRALECHVHEGYDSGDSVILTRERRRWLRELTGTVELCRFEHVADLRDELICQVFRAVVGTSRLPLHAVEAPLVAFSFGELFYCYQSVTRTQQVVRGWPEFLRVTLTAELCDLEQVRLLETLLRAVPPAELASAAKEFHNRWSALGRSPREILALLRALFNEASLSPWTDLADKVLGFLQALAERPLATAEIVDFLGHLLRQTGRHLTAYDLVTFHYRGANYPDALLLDAVLKAYLRLIEQRPDLFQNGPDDDDSAATVIRRRRRALRQAWILRRQYEGHAVPDLPTSPGENSRVLPPSHPRVPEEQILVSSRRTRRLFLGDFLPDRPAGATADILRQSVIDLDHTDELRELGLGLFIERPFGAGKAPAEPDNTLLLASIAFSRSLAVQRLRWLTDLGLLSQSLAEDLCRRLERAPIRGLPLDAIGPCLSPGAMGLSLARQAASDFIFLRTMPGGVAELLRQFDFVPLSGTTDLSWLTGTEPVLIARAPVGAGVRIYDRHLQPRLELESDATAGFISRAGREVPAQGLLARLLAGPGSQSSVIVRLPTSMDLKTG